MTHPPGPRRLVQTRLTTRADGGSAEAALDSTKTAWARCITDGAAWTPWALVAAGAIDVDIAAATDDVSLAHVVVTPASPGDRRIFSLRFDGTVVATSL
jgi:hypothetical protein